MNVTAFQNAYLSRINTIEQSKEINLRVANALRFVIQNVFANITNSFVFTISTNGGATEFWLHDTMRKLFATWGLIAIQFVVLNSNTTLVDVPVKSYCNMIMVDSFQSLQKTNIAEYNRNSDSLEYYYIFLQVHDTLLDKEMEKITRYCFDNYWIHCNIMAQNSKGEILVYTYFPFKEKDCFKTEPELINRFMENKFENVVMFPDKLKNLQGCVFRLSTWYTAPFVSNVTNKSLPNLPGGFEIFTLAAISEKMNFTLDVEWLSIDTYDQKLPPETKPISKLKNYETNFTMGYFRRTAERDQIATPSYSTYYIPVVAIILRKESKYNFMGLWTLTFDTPTWIIIIVSYIFIGMLNVFQKMEIKGGICEIFGIIIGVPINILTKSTRTSTRIRFMTTLISSFILRSVYQSLLFHIFRTNFYQTPPLTIHSLVKDGYRSISTELTLRFLHNVPVIRDKLLPVQEINNTNEMYPLRYLESHRNESLVAMSISEFATRYAVRELGAYNALQILPINVKDQQVCIYLPKHSYLSDRFDHNILFLHQAGLLNKWRDWTIHSYKVSKGQDFTAHKNTLMVNLNQLIGFLYLVIFLLLTSILLFVLELLSKRVKWLEIIFFNDFSTYLCTFKEKC